MPIRRPDPNKITPETASALYRAMLKTRLAEQRVAEIYPTDKIQSPIHLSIGQEAIAAGVCAALAPEDHIYGTYRGHGIYISKGGDLGKMFAELYGKETGCARGRGGSMHLVAPEIGFMACSAIVASTIPVATGDALASAMSGRKRIAVSFFGDGALEEGVFYESASFAVLKNLPVIYVVENNAVAVHSPLTNRRRDGELYKVGQGFGLPGYRFDGGDESVVYQTMAQARRDILKGGGPVLLEYTTHRWFEHVGPNLELAPSAYKSKDYVRRAKAADPLKTSKDRLLKRFKIAPALLKAWEAEIAAEIDAAVAFAEQSPFPKPEALLEDVFA
jgi:acetoin:2,6-dichlorophenolindophenol oxidoreductase subunit alpha